MSGRKKLNRTMEEKREQARIRRQRYYEKHKERVREENRIRYHRNKVDKKLSDV